MPYQRFLSVYLGCDQLLPVSPPALVAENFVFSEECFVIMSKKSAPSPIVIVGEQFGEQVKDSR